MSITFLFVNNYYTYFRRACILSQTNVNINKKRTDFSSVRKQNECTVSTCKATPSTTEKVKASIFIISSVKTVN